MYNKHFSLKTIAALVLVLGALAQPAWAVTNISACTTITKPGAYQLTKSLKAPGDCIIITASNVTLNLGGSAEW